MPTATKDKTGSRRKKTTKKKVAQSRNLISVAQFDSHRVNADGTSAPFTRFTRLGVPIKDFPIFTAADYSPYGGTPLNDAVIAAIGQAETQLAANPNDVITMIVIDESGSMSPNQDAVVGGINEFLNPLRGEQPETGGRVLVVIMTDGYENASVEDPTGEKVRELIGRKSNENFTFLYLGANHDAWAQGSSLGLQQYQTKTFTSSRRGTSSSLRSAGMLAHAHSAGGQSMYANLASATPDVLPENYDNTKQVQDALAHNHNGGKIWTPGDEDDEGGDE